MFTRRVMTIILVSFAFLTGATATRVQDKFPTRTIPHHRSICAGRWRRHAGAFCSPSPAFDDED
jgi:hypothetical protein